MRRTDSESGRQGFPGGRGQNSLRSAVLAGIALTALWLLTGEAATPPQEVDWETWEKTIGEELIKFLPGPVEGLSTHFPWEDPRDNQPQASGGWGEAGGGGLYPVRVSRRWRYSDPELVQKVEALNKQQEEMLKRAELLGSQIKKEGWAKASQAMKDEFMGLSSKLESLGNMKDNLESSARGLVLEIDSNCPPEVWLGQGVQPIGKFKDYPFFRQTGETGHELSLVLAVYLGPPGCGGQAARSGPIKLELKCLLVRIGLSSDEEHARADEVVARQILDRVDFDELAKLLGRREK